MSKVHDILLYLPIGQLPFGLPETLQGADYSTHIVHDLADLLEMLEVLEHPILVTESGRSEDESIDLVKVLITQESLKTVPLVLVGKEADGFESILDEYFKHSVTLNTPCTTQDVVNAIRFLERSYSWPEPTPTTPIASEFIIEELSKTESIPDQIFDEMEQLGGAEKKIGGAELKHRFTLEELDGMGILPSNEILRTGINDVYTTVKPWVQDHLCRTAYILERFNEVLELPLTEREHARAACFLLPCAFAKYSSTPLRKNYLQASHGARQEISTKLKDSALHIMGKLAHPPVGEIVAGLAKLIDGDGDPLDEEIPLTSSSLLAAELIDRISFQSGYWSSRGAHFLLKEAKSGNLHHFVHPKAIACMIKFLSEAITHLPQPFITKRE
ncbi:MAG: hypothetical protein KDD55_01025, partial [Bdellovibrionales bacterium]|nr:hypothetical protein [Bdellovibrionales bacterium]